MGIHLEVTCTDTFLFFFSSPPTCLTNCNNINTSLLEPASRTGFSRQLAVISTTTKISEKKRKRGFLDLPPEIRVIVYDILLKGKGTVNIRRSPYGREFPIVTTCQPKIRASIVFVNKVIYKEALPILYNKHIFYARDPALMTTFIQRLGLSIQHLSHISIDYNSILDFRADFKAMISTLTGATDLRTLKLAQSLYHPGEAWSPLFASATGVLDRLMPLLEALHRARPNESGEARSASDLLLVRIMRIDHEYWRTRYAEAEELEMGVKTLLDETIFA